MTSGRNSLIFIALAAISLCGGKNARATTSIDLKGPFLLEATYVGDIYGNFAGGIQTGAGYLGMANLKIGFDTEKAGWWNGGEFYVNGASTHGKSPSENFVGDFQVVSNIDAGNLVYLHELWFRQSFRKLELTVGLQDMNTQFAATENGGYYLNSSFGVPPVISGNVPAPIFPLTGLGISAIYSISDRVKWLAAMFDGAPTDFENNPYNLYWDWDRDDGSFLITEVQLSTTIFNQAGTCKGGAYFHTGSSEEDGLGMKSQTVDKSYGIYVIADQDVWKGSQQRRSSFFTQLAWSPGELSNHNFYVGCGVNYYGLLGDAHENTLGLAVAYAGFHRGLHKHESVIESFLNYRANKNFSLQPDFQFVINPAGTDAKLKDAFIGFLRVKIEF
ncbi:MAG TPA: carbohydrate porin [Prolixibacteraceae bacterium]|nr:carbohydrate porin [Prolixibacteraceae bacterium]